MKKTLSEIKKEILTPLRQATLVFLIKDNSVLLAMKKRGFGEGKWNGSGGKLKDGETIEEAAKREVEEEIGVFIENPAKIACLNFYFAHKPDWNQQVTVYLVNKWKGEPTESEEMIPKWFKISEVPYNQMWDDDKYWLPQVLSGSKIEADLLFDENQKTKEKIVKEF